MPVGADTTAQRSGCRDRVDLSSSLQCWYAGNLGCSPRGGGIVRGDGLRRDPGARRRHLRRAGRAVRPAWRRLRRVVARLFPWGARARRFLGAPAVVQRPDRAARPRARLGPEWGWWCAPLEEWDGSRIPIPCPATDHRATGGRASVGGNSHFCKMVLDFPEVVDAEPVGQLDLLQGVGEQAVLVVGCPGSRELVLVEDPESHGGS